MTGAANRPLEVLVDITRTVQARGRMVGTVRVESELASALLRIYPDIVVPVAWSATDERFVEIDRGAAAQYCSPEGGPDVNVTGPPLDTTRPNDGSRRRILLVSGGGWLSNIKFLHGMFDARRTLGAELHVVVHDLVHLLFPQWAPREEALKSGSALEAVLAGVDRVLVYSDSTASDIAAASKARGFAVPDVARVALGTTLMLREGDDPVSDGLDGVADRPFVPYVSTIAARKNHVFIAQVWARLAAELGTRLPRLLFIGRVAEDQASMMERLGRDPALAEHLIHIPDATDADVAWLYANCAFTVFPSLYEGWGLPVAESLALGKVCLASDVSSIPEVARDATPLLDPLDVRAWCDAVRTMALDQHARAAAERRVRERYRPVTWPEAADRFWQAMLAPLRSSDRPVQIRTMSSTGPEAITSSIVVRQPWRPLRTPRGRVEAFRTRLGLELNALPARGVGVGFDLWNAAPCALRVETDINGAVSDGCVIDAGATHVRRVNVPRDVLMRRGLLDLAVVAKPMDDTCPTAAVPLVTLDGFTFVPLTPEEEALCVHNRRETWRVGKKQTFTAGSAGLSLLGPGWGEAAPWGVWTVEPSAVMTFRPTPSTGEPLRLHLAVRTFVWPSHPQLDVQVRAGDRHLTTWTFQHPQEVTFVEPTVVIPPEAIVDGVVRLQFEMPNCRSPRELGMSDDERKLGIGLARAFIEVM
jgi:glycosyltransferase involved in cell wall biosynthesis